MYVRKSMGGNQGHCRQSRKDNGPNVERNLKCFRVEKSQFEKIFRKKNRDEVQNSPYSVLMRATLYYRVVRGLEVKSRGWQRRMIRSSQRDKRKMEERCHWRVFLEKGMFSELFSSHYPPSHLSLPSLSASVMIIYLLTNDYQSHLQLQAHLPSEPYIQPLTWYLHLNVQQPAQNKMAKH